MKFRNKIIAVMMLVSLTLIGCSTDTNDKDSKIKVVSSFSLITDMVKTIGKEHVEVYNLAPVGTDPHDFEAKPEDLREISDSEILFYNGMNLEGGEGGWLSKIVNSLQYDTSKMVNLGEGVTPKYLIDGNVEDSNINPHSFLSPQVGIIMATNVKKALIARDPFNENEYTKNADEYIAELEAIDKEYQTVIDSISEEHRIFVASERAFQYMADEYGLRLAYIWEVDTEELGTPQQLKQLLEYLKTDAPPYLFLESNVDPKPMETVSKESNIPIYEERVYSDEISATDDRANTYLKMLRHNIKVISDGLK